MVAMSSNRTLLALLIGVAVHFASTWDFGKFIKPNRDEGNIKRP